jgi:hypothetical protein
VAGGYRKFETEVTTGKLEGASYMLRFINEKRRENWKW